MSDPTDPFEQLVARYGSLLAHAVRVVCGWRGRSWAPDVEQEVRLALWSRLRSGKKIEYPASYIYKVALTTGAAVLRKQGREHARMEDELPEVATESPSPRGLLLEERRLLLEEAFEMLTPEQADALRAYLAGFNHVEVARMFGWTESVARHHIYRGRAALRRLGKER